MAIRVVRLGSPRAKDEGLRIGTVRRPPRGVAKKDYSRRNFYDVWLPDLAPSAGLVKQALGAADERAWNTFAKRYRTEMKRPEAARLLGLLAALSQSADFSVGCYCADESRCHRSVLKALLKETGCRELGATSPDGRFTVIEVECLGACGFPTPILVDDDFIENVTPEKVKGIVQRYE